MLPLITIFLAIGSVSMQDLPAVDPGYGAFAFPNVAGTELIVVHEVPNAAAFRTAVCGGQLLSVRFVRYQTVSGQSADREWPNAFNHLEGAIFQIVGRRVPSTNNCFVAADSLLENAELLPVRAFSEPVACSAAERRRAAALHKRTIRACWSAAKVPQHGLVSVVEYARAGADGLASLIVVTNERTIAIDFHAKYNGDGQEMWRAGDDGRLSPDGINVPFVVRRGHTYIIALDWGAEEGNALTLYSSEPGVPARMVISDYWYRAPR